ncbi:hypothetical protein AAZX31_08G301200 [Glycine max]|uniref:Uncharacterized protein n=3 Tax=Glycine subgen. Soja TaxID=1462606 RepID=I1KY49_SOYBN|nr:spermidine hydroxycinnamoyl transferase [Glycine max]XP_028245925.1 spermidine hydroxycinnamoyl transferase-like [Glycine soja]KAG5001936.1 hypothetical protein JHK87_023008 [Glycine soja]KAG5017475.1 hypothetical protein JHK85_023611 [Glycine max]KAG5027225.1 hypothetical protein JHK86_023139 [Glycine max]KAG5138358.1 hypothetical protein JHK82_023089 [Glycine max]KAH1054008.1 hypothetical protein GYH30_022993 [Glycine max]|eukprot:XP_003532114.1 spermidine hydroxycinnamoyl transferase [Glycine max]
MVTIVGSYNVTPNQPTPKDPLWLSNSDLIGFQGYVPTLYVYKAKPNYSNNIIERLRNSLSKLLVYYYPVAGRLSLTKSGRMEVDCNAKGVTLIEAETTNTFADYGDFTTPSESTDELVPKIDSTQPIEETPILVVQLTRFRGGDEGLAVGFGMFHSLTDATGIIHFMNRWAKLARGEELNPNEIPFLDRTILQLFSSSSQHVDQPEWKPITQAQGVEQKQRSCSLLKLTSSQVERLKKKTNDESPKELGVRPYSRFEAIAAHIWRCASKARAEYSNSNHPTIVRFSVNIRNRLLTPPIPESYFGNALARTTTPKCYEGDIISNPLSFAAQKLREAVNPITGEYIKSQLSVGLGQEQLDHIRAFFMRQEHGMKTPYIAGEHNNVILLTSLMTMPVYEADFGWGKPMQFGLPRGSLDDRVGILPSPDGDGVVVNVFFQEAILQRFKKLFYEDVYISSL